MPTPAATTPAAEPRDQAWQLARAAAQGDLQATGALLTLLAPRMIRTAQSLMGREHPDLDDVVQQSLIALAQGLPRFREECTPAQFATGIVTRTVISVRHRSKRRGERFDSEVELESLDAHAKPLGEHVDAERRRVVVRSLLSELPEAQAETFALRVALGFSLGEVAAATGVPLNTVRSRIRLAKEALRRRIEADPSLGALLEVE